MECKELNAQYRKNQTYDEIKSHHYIFSFDPKDVEESGLTGKRAQQLGLEYARKNFPGHQALVCTHTDGHNESGKPDIRLTDNSAECSQLAVACPTPFASRFLIFTTQQEICQMHDFYAIDISCGQFVQCYHIFGVVVFDFKAAAIYNDGMMIAC